VDAAIFKELLARETAAALLEVTEAASVVVFTETGGADVRVVAAAGCDTSVATGLAHAGRQGHSEYDGKLLIVEALGTDLDGARRCALALAAGAASFARDTRTVGPGLMETPDADTLAFAGSVELRAGFALASGAAARLELELSAAAVFVPAAPVLRYRTATGTRDEQLWWLQPELRLGPYLRVRL